MVILLQEKNFGPNVIYYVFVTNIYIYMSNFYLANILYFEVGSFDLTGLLYYCYFILLVFGVDGRWSCGHFMRYVFFYWVLLVGSHL